MLWKEYYEKLPDWSTSTAVSRMSQLESFGAPDEIVDAINTIGFDDEQGATRLLKKATAAGVKFSGDQLSELCLICKKDVLLRAVYFSADKFKTEDLDALYGTCDEEVLIEIAKRYRLRIPDVLAEYAEAADISPEEEAYEDVLSTEEVAAEYDYILTCLYDAYELLKKSFQAGLIDTRRRHRGATVIKYAYLADAQALITKAENAWDLLDIPDKDPRVLQGIWPDVGNATMWKNFIFEGKSTNMMVKQRIRRAMKNIETAYRELRKQRKEL